MVPSVVGAAAPIDALGPTKWMCDAPMMLRDIQDCSLMAVVAVVVVDPWIQVLPPFPFDQTVIEPTILVHSSLVCGTGVGPDSRACSW
jgi:hypothetical protein